MSSPHQERWQFVHPATGCQKCPQLAQQRHTVVWSRGPEQAPVMVIGEAPGYNEDMSGLPFNGASGRDMQEMLKEADFPFGFGDLHIGNVLMCRPPGNRDPEPEEVLNCSPWLTEHIRMVNPEVLICFGRYSIRSFFDKATVADTQGLMYQWQCDGCGAKDHEHLLRYAKDGGWNGTSVLTIGHDSSDPQENPAGSSEVATLQTCKESRRLVAAIYHPASAFGHRNPENRAAIVHQLRRVAEEIEWQRLRGQSSSE